MAKHPASRQRELSPVSRILSVFALTLLGIICLMAVYHGYNRAVTLVSTRTSLFVFSGIGGAGFLVCGAARLYAARLNKFKQDILSMATALFLILGLCSLFMAFYFTFAVRILYVALPSAALLYLIWVVYQREFFVLTCITALGGFSCVVIGLIYTQHPRVSAALAIGCIAASLLLAAGMAFLKNGELKLCRHVLPLRQGDGLFTYIACALTIAAALLFLLFGPVAAYYAAFALFGYLFVMAVCYTVKLM